MLREETFKVFGIVVLRRIFGSERKAGTELK
jgi:hypothetical protein